MEILDHFSIPVSGLRNGLHGYDFEIDQEFFRAFEASPIQRGNVEVHLDFDKRDDLYVMLFFLQGKVEVTCDRCLDPFNIFVEDRPSLLVKFDEKEWEDADVVYILKGTLTLNVARYIYEFINLAVPIIKTHEEAGESCNPEMIKYLDQEPEESESPNLNPFRDALKDLNLDN